MRIKVNLDIPEYIKEKYKQSEIEDMLQFRKRGFEWDECESTLAWRKEKGLFKD